MVNTMTYTSFKTYWLFIFLLSSLTPCSTLFAKDIPWDKLHGFGDVDYFQIENPKKANENKSYHVFVRLPEEVNNTDKQTFPVLYLLDGGTNFPLVAGMYKYLRWMQDIPPMIIVGISYGTDDWQQGNDRSHDFTVPSKEREHWGGAQVFEQFFVDTLMPAIQKKYPVDINTQILYGQSLGGQFGIYSTMYGQAPFYGVIASNPALHRNLDYFKQPMMTRKTRPKLFVSIAEFDNERYKIPSSAWVSFWQQQQVAWSHKFVTLDGQNHLSATPDAVRNGLVWMFE